jgi:serine protease Do
MKKNKRSIRMWVALAMIGLTILACGPKDVVTTPVPPPNVPPSNPDVVVSGSDLIYAVVQIFGVHFEGGNIVPFYVGSGSIISSTGLILTNAHVADPAAVGEAGMTPDGLAIGIVQSEDAPPVYSYLAEVRAIDGFMDLAVIQITSTLKGDSLDPSSLNLPYVDLGNSDNIHVGNHINILGFPAIGGNTITYTDGNVSGFSPEDQLGDRAWIKTDATISGGNSGGMATDDQGHLIGVPSIASSGADTEATDCRVIQDTNGDGSIDSRDTCIPIGGFINALRPINLAMPLIKAAQSGQVYRSPYSQQYTPPAPPSGHERMGDIGWYTLDQQGNLGDQVSSFPHGATIMVALFEFSGFTNGETWGEVWSYGGETIYSDTYTWDQGSDGVYATYLANQGDPLPDGTYHLELYAGSGNAPLTQSDVVVGTGQNVPQPPAGNDIQLSGTITDKSTGNPIPDAYVLVLVSGVTYEDWAASNYPEVEILSYTKSNSYGQYVLPIKLSRNTPFTVVASAQGYYDAYGNNLVWDDSEPSDFTLDISLGK